MATYLREDEVGHDPNVIGFPTLGSCMGLAVVTANGLYGFHMPPGHENRIGGFETLYHGHAPLKLLSCCRFAHRYQATGGQGFLKWLQEIKIFGRAIGYRGPVLGVDLSSLLGDNTGVIAGGESAYCQFTLMPGGAVSVGASLTSNTAATTTIQVGTAIRRLDAAAGRHVPYQSKVISQIAPTPGNTLTAPANGKALYEFSL